MKKQIDFVYGKTLSLPLYVGDIVELPITATEDLTIGAMSLIYFIPNEYIKITKVSMSNGEEVLSHFVDEPEVTSTPHERSGWYAASTPLELKSGEVFMSIEFEVVSDIPMGTEIKFVMMDDPLVEFAGDAPEFVSYQNKTISINLVKKVKLTATKAKEYQEYLSKPIHQMCSNCKHLMSTKCGLGGFVVAKGGVCKLYE